MKVGRAFVKIGNDSTSAKVRDRDVHVEASKTAPNCRPPNLSSNFQNLFIFNAILKMSRVVHNHPSGDPTPSQADIQTTKSIIDIAKPLGIAVHDHIIVGQNGHATLKGLRLT
jgi:hypothetical protein